MKDLKEKFIVDDNFDEKKLAEYVERLLPFCKISKSGEVLVEIERATATEKVKFGLASRARSFVF